MEENKKKVDTLINNDVDKGEKEQDLNSFLENYEPTEKLKNIADLEKVNFDDVKNVKWKTFRFTKEDGKVQLSHKAIALINGENIIIPASVIKSLKNINCSSKIPGKIKVFTVNKSGEGLNTEYDVIPIKMSEELKEND